MKTLTEEKILDELKTLDSQWTVHNQSLIRKFEFQDFVQAFAFMSSVALHAEKAEHHPNWENTYNKVKIALTTHDAGGLTEKDFKLARSIDDLI